MLSSGLRDTPTTTALLLALPTISLLTTLLAWKPYLPILLVPHLYPHFQLSRALTHQLAHTSSSTLLFTCVLLYHLRVLERLYSPRKYASLLLVTAPITAFATVISAVVMKLLSGGRYNYVPAGFTAPVFVLLAMYDETAPPRWSVLVRLMDDGHDREHHHNQNQNQRTGTKSEERGGGGSGPTLKLSDKWTTYLLAGQLACAHLPYSLLPAAVGWVVGKAYRREVLPSGITRWRIPRRVWTMVGGDGSSGGREREMVEGLRRRLREEEAEAEAEAEASGRDGASRGGGGSDTWNGEGSSAGRRR